jgi:hypothetical protein
VKGGDRPAADADALVDDFDRRCEAVRRARRGGDDVVGIGVVQVVVDPDDDAERAFLDRRGDDDLAHTALEVRAERFAGAELAGALEYDVDAVLVPVDAARRRLGAGRKVRAVDRQPGVFERRLKKAVVVDGQDSRARTELGLQPRDLVGQRSRAVGVRATTADWLLGGDRKRRILEALAEESAVADRAGGAGITAKEFVERLGCGRASVYETLRALRAAGALDQVDHRYRLSERSLLGKALRSLLEVLRPLGEVGGRSAPSGLYAKVTSTFRRRVDLRLVAR